MFVVDLREYRSKVTSTGFADGRFWVQMVQEQRDDITDHLGDDCGRWGWWPADNNSRSYHCFFSAFYVYMYTWCLNNMGARGADPPHSRKPARSLQSALCIWVLNLSTNRRLCSTVVHIYGKKCTSKFSPGQFKLCCSTVSCILFIYQLFLFFFPQLFLLKTNIRSTYRSNNLLFYYNLEY